MYEITFQFENGAQEVHFSAAPGSTILEAAKAANVAIDAPCNGNGSCGKCRVKLVSGDVTGMQTGHISDADYAAGWRLGCATKPAGDITVLVPDIASAYQSRMKTADLSSGEEIAIFNQLQEDVQAAGVDFTNDFVQALVELDEPTLDDTMPDTERLSRFAQAAFDGCTEVRLTYHTVKKLAKTLRDANFKVLVSGTLTDGVLTVMDVSEKPDAPLYGCAIDIGTTTVTGVLMDLATGTLTAKASAGNGQIRYGADVINRIVEQSKPGGVKRLQDAILKETLLPLVAAMCKSAGVPVSRIFRVCIASNTTMNHLLLGVDANPVRMEPYIPTFFQWRGMTAKDLGFPANPDAEILLAPNIGSYVGGDITAGAFTSLIWDKDEFSLFIDLGTNGELVFGNRDFMMSCACSAGPAFEGGDISCGMRATAIPWSPRSASSARTDRSPSASAAPASSTSSLSSTARRSSPPRVSSCARASASRTTSTAWAAISSLPPRNPRRAARSPSPRSTSTRSSAPRPPFSRPSTSCSPASIWT